MQDPPFAERLEVSGHVQELVVMVEVRELFLHCAEAFPRSSIWEPSTWPDRRSVPSAARMVEGQYGSGCPRR